MVGERTGEKSWACDGKVKTLLDAGEGIGKGLCIGLPNGLSSLQKESGEGEGGVNEVGIGEVGSVSGGEGGPISGDGGDIREPFIIIWAARRSSAL